MVIVIGILVSILVSMILFMVGRGVQIWLHWFDGNAPRVTKVEPIDGTLLSAPPQWIEAWLEDTGGSGIDGDTCELELSEVDGKMVGGQCQFLPARDWHWWLMGRDKCYLRLVPDTALKSGSYHISAQGRDKAGNSSDTIDSQFSILVEPRVRLKAIGCNMPSPRNTKPFREFILSISCDADTGVEIQDLRLSAALPSSVAGARVEDLAGSDADGRSMTLGPAQVNPERRKGVMISGLVIGAPTKNGWQELRMPPPSEVLERVRLEVPRIEEKSASGRCFVNTNELIVRCSYLRSGEYLAISVSIDTRIPPVVRRPSDTLLQFHTRMGKISRDVPFKYECSLFQEEEPSVGFDNKASQ